MGAQVRRPHRRVGTRCSTRGYPAWALREGERTAAAYVPLSFAPGEAYQFDWSHEHVLLDGVTVTVKVAQVRLCHSRMPFVRAYKAEIAAKHARSIDYQMGIAKLPLAKELADLALDGTPISAGLIEQLSSGDFLQSKRNVVLIGGTGTGKSHIAIGIARSVIRAGKKARFFNAVDLVNKLEAEAKLGRGGRIADGITRVDLLVLDELGYTRTVFTGVLAINASRSALTAKASGGTTSPSSGSGAA